MNRPETSRIWEKYSPFYPELTKPQMKFFESEKGKSKNASRDRSIATEHLRKSLQYLNYLTRHSKNLRDKDIEEIFTAQTLQNFLEEILKETKQTYYFKKFKHDFRTTEIARLLFEISSEYLRDATNSKTVKMDLERISDHFIAQSEAKLESETYAEHGNEKERELTKKEEIELNEKRQDKIEKYHKLHSNKEVIKLNDEYDKAYLKKSRVHADLEYKKMTKNQKIKLNEEFTKLKEIVKENYESLREIDHNAIDQIHNIEIKLEKKFTHLNYVYSKKKFLSQFLSDMINSNHTIPEPDDGTRLLMEPAREGFSGFSVPLKYVKDGHEITKEDREHYTSPYYRFSIIRSHDKIKWYGNEPSADIPELRKYPPFNRFSGSVWGIIPLTIKDDD